MHAPKQDINANTELQLKQQTATAQRATPNAQSIPSSPDEPLVQHLSQMGNSPNPSAHAAILNRAPANQQSSNQQLLLHWQQQYGNPYVNQVLQLARQTKQKTSTVSTQPPGLQAKLTIGAVGDKYEQEADRTAQQVVQQMNAPASQQPEAREIQKKPQISTIQRQKMPQPEEEKDEPVQLKSETGIVQRVCSKCDKEQQPGQQENQLAQMQPLVQRQSADKEMAATPDLEKSIQRAQGKGQPLSEPIREQMEQAFGADFSGVRIHTGSESDQLNKSIQARAFTTGQDIFLRSGEYPPTSQQAQELLVHELTHVVQQNGSAVQSKVPSTANATSHASNGEGVSVATKSSTDSTIQRACSQCEHEKQDVNLQAKRESDNTVEATPEVEASISQVDRPTVQRIALADTGSTVRERPEPKEENKPQTPQETTESDDSNCDRVDNTNNSKPEDKQSEQPQKCPSEKEQDEDNKEQKPPKTQPNRDKLAKRPAICDRKELKSNKLEILPENVQYPPAPTPQHLTATPALTTGKEALASKQNSSATDEAVSPKTVAEKTDATKSATNAQEQLETTNAEVVRLAASKINFKLPKQDGTDTNNRAVATEDPRSTASSMASNFFTEATLRVQTVTGLGQSISTRINGVAETAKASIMSTVQQQKDTVTAQINQQRTQVQNQAQASIAGIQQQYQATLINISLRTAEVNQRIQTEYSNTFQKIDRHEIDLLARIDNLYFQIFDQFIAAGEKVGNEAIATGEKWAKQWYSEKKDETQYVGTFTPGPTFTNGPQNIAVENNNKLNKKADTAKEVAKQYKDQVTEEATKQANNLVDGKTKDIKVICCGVKEFRKELQKYQEEAFKAVTDLRQEAVKEARKAQTKLTESVNQTLQDTLQSLDEQETAQLQILQGYGELQVLAIERDAQKAIASLLKGVNQAANKLQTALHDYYREFQGMEAPNPGELSLTLAEILGQFDSSIATIQEETEKGITVSEAGITQGEQQAVDAVGAIARIGIKELGVVVEAVTTSFTDLNKGITDTFNQLRDVYTQAANKVVETTATSLEQITQNPFEGIYQKFSEAIQKSVTKLEEGLRQSLECLETDIKNYAAKAVEEEPWWKTLLKGLVFIAVIVIAIFVAPLAIGFVAGGLVALGVGVTAATIASSIVVGAALGAALGALAQIANNAIDGKNLLKDVWKAAAAGAIGGAIGGLFGGAGSVLGRVGKLGTGLTKSFSQYGIETVIGETLGNVVGNLAVGEPITAKGILEGLVIGTGVHVSTAKLHGIAKRSELADFANTHPDKVGNLSGMKPDEINALAQQTGMNPGELARLAKLDPGKLAQTIKRAQAKSGSSKLVKFARGFEKTQTGGYQFGERVGSALTSRIKSAFGGSRGDADISKPSTHPDVSAETPKSLKPDTDVPMIPREQEILENTAPKRGNELTPEEWKTELEVAEKIEPKPTSDGEFIEQRELPNNHELKEKEDGSFCRASNGCDPVPDDIVTNWLTESKRSIIHPRSDALKNLDRAVQEYQSSRQALADFDNNIKNLNNILEQIKAWRKTKGRRGSRRDNNVNQLETIVQKYLDDFNNRKEQKDKERAEALPRYETFRSLEPELDKYAKRDDSHALESFAPRELNPDKVLDVLSRPRNIDNSLTQPVIDKMTELDRSTYKLRQLELSQKGNITVDSTLTRSDIEDIMNNNINSVTNKTIYPELSNFTDMRDNITSNNVTKNMTIQGVDMEVTYDPTDVNYTTRIQMFKEAVEKVKAKGFTLPKMKVNLPKYGRQLKVSANKQVEIVSGSSSERAIYVAPDFIHISSANINNPIDSKARHDSSKFANLSTELDPTGVATIVHELGHAVHFSHTPSKFHGLWKTSFKEGSLALSAQQEVSQYGMKPREFVAEVFLGLVYGKTYPPKIIEMYQSFGGLMPVGTSSSNVKSSETQGKAPETTTSSDRSINFDAPETAAKATDTKGKELETTAKSDRSTHYDEPEIEPGVVAKDKATDGTEFKVSKDGEVLACSSPCERTDVDSETQQEPKAQKKAENAKRQYEEIDKEADTSNSSKKAKQFPEFPKKVKGSTTVNTDEKGRHWLVDSRGQQWFLNTSRAGNDYWQSIPKKKGKSGGYHVSMRTTDAKLTMQDIANYKNTMDAYMHDYEWGVIKEGKPVLANAVNNPVKREQQGTVMARYFGLEAVKSARGDKNGSYLSASDYAKEKDWEWLHMHGHSLGGVESPVNLVAGSHGANTEMAAIESAVSKFMNSHNIALKVTPLLETDIRLGKPSLKAVKLTYEVTVNGKSLIKHDINAKRQRMGNKEYQKLERDVSFVIQHGKPRPIEFVSGENYYSSFKFGYGADVSIGSRSDVDVSALSSRTEVGTEAPKGLKPNTNVPMTPREQEILENTTPKRGNELTPEEWKTELEVAEKVEPKPIPSGEFVEQRELPNNHKLKEKKDGSLCRASDNCDSVPDDITRNWLAESKKSIIHPRSDALKSIDRAVEQYQINLHKAPDDLDNNIKNLENILERISAWKNAKTKDSRRDKPVNELKDIANQRLQSLKNRKKQKEAEMQAAKGSDESEVNRVNQQLSKLKLNGEENGSSTAELPQTAMQVDEPTSKPTKGKEKAKELGYPEAEPGYHWALQKDGTLRYDRNNQNLPKRVYNEQTGEFLNADSNTLKRKRRGLEFDEAGYQGGTEETQKNRPENYQERRADVSVGTKVDFLSTRPFRTERRLRRLGYFKERNIYVVSYVLPNGKRVRIAAVSQPPRQLPTRHENIDESTLASLTKPGHSEAVHNKIEANYPEVDKATRRYEATTREQCGGGKGGASCRYLYPSDAEKHYYSYPYSAAEDHIHNKDLLNKVLDNIRNGRGPTSGLTETEKREYKEAESSATWARQNAEEQNSALRNDLEQLGKKDSDEEYSSDEDPIHIPPEVRRGIGDSITKLGKAPLIDIPADKTLSPQEMTQQKEWVKQQKQQKKKEPPAKKQKPNKQTKQSQTDSMEIEPSQPLTIGNEQFNKGNAKSPTTDKDKEKEKLEASAQRDRYEPTLAQINSLPQNLEVVPINPDGDCLFNALIRMGVHPNNVNSASDFRQFIAARVISEDSAFVQNMNQHDIAEVIKTPGSYDNDVGDMTPSLIARELNINIIVHNEDGTTTEIDSPGSNQTIHLIRVTTPLNHYHATQFQNDANEF